jgi:hypothetical protein
VAPLSNILLICPGLDSIDQGRHASTLAENLPTEMAFNETYRVQGIPAQLTEEECRKLLNSVLADDSENLEPVIYSLSVDPYRSDCKIATSTVKRCPKRLQGGRDEWTIPIEAPRNRSNNRAVSSITVDTHFSGFTPLDFVPDSSGHNIE